MLTQLSINGRKYDALHLLGLLQQIWPAQEKPDGDGDTQTGWKTPWKPDKAGKWFWSSKQIAKNTRVKKFETPVRTPLDAGDKLFWFNIAGRIITITADTLYARDYGNAAEMPPRGGAPGKKPADISYAGIYGQLLDDNAQQLNDKNAATNFRDVLKGTAPGAGFSSLRLLAAVMFLSEVARNHTAFHTGLMLLDLIEKGIKIDTSNFEYTWKNSLWSPGTIDAILANKTKSKDQKVKAPAVAGEADAARVPTTPGGEAALQARGMGLAPMSHVFSESGGAFNLEGQGTFAPPEGTKVTNVQEPMTLVRKKEATLLIRWLYYALKTKHPALDVAVGDEASTFDHSKAYNFGPEYFADHAGGLLDKMYIVPLLTERVTSLDCMINAV